ncbi:hypothetical protein HDV03_000731 [Kappamyces sp. JEL0829]|nr:hypothetical protein HDV03_000731 [Kappamyces sp. JEL0829]
MDSFRIPQKVSRRLGNWCEESILREEKLREFLAKVESGQVEFKRKEKRIEIANHPSTFTNGYLAAVLPEQYPNVSKDEQIEVVTSSTQDPREGKARSCFVLERFEETGAVDQHVRWGEKVYVSIRLPGLEMPLYLSSEPVNPSAHRLNSTQQHVFLSFQKCAKALWKFEWGNPEYRLEMDGRIIEPNVDGLLVHVQTGKPLSAAMDATFVVK